VTRAIRAITNSFFQQNGSSRKERLEISA